MKKKRPFLTAHWSNLCIFTYEVPPALLEPHLPPGLELDMRDGSCFASLVAFQFLDTCVWGIPWPGFRHFPELNLRFYVRWEGRRGVVFVRELVPQRLVAWIARLLYNEPYVAAPLQCTILDESATLTAEYRLDWQQRAHTMRMTGARPAIRPPPASLEHFFKEHQWGFGTDRRGRLTVYEVQHPEWDVYPIVSHALDFDFAQVYGPAWSILNQAVPYSTVFAVGSDVAVYPRKVVRVV